MKHVLVLEPNTKIHILLLADDFEPQQDSGEFHSHERQNSAVHIKVFKTAV